MSERRTSTSARRGFTILELLIVIVMMGALAAISLGKSSSIITQWRLNRATQAWSEELQTAFALVGRNRKPVVIEFRKDSMNLTIRSRTDAAGNKTIFRRRNFGMDSEFKLDSSNVSLSVGAVSTAPYTYKLEVYPPGLAADSLSVVIKKNGLGKRLRMLRGGLTQICFSTLTSTC